MVGSRALDQDGSNLPSLRRVIDWFLRVVGCVIDGRNGNGGVVFEVVDDWRVFVQYPLELKLLPILGAKASRLEVNVSMQNVGSTSGVIVEKGDVFQPALVNKMFWSCGKDLIEGLAILESCIIFKRLFERATCRNTEM